LKQNKIPNKLFRLLNYISFTVFAFYLKFSISISFKGIFDCPGPEFLSTTEIVAIFKEEAQDGWCILEKDEYIKFCKLEENDYSALPQVSFLFTLNFQNGKATLHHYGQSLDLAKIASEDYNKISQSLHPFSDNVKHFIAKLKRLAFTRCTVKDLMKVSQCLVEQCIEQLETSNNSTDENADNKKITTLKFINEQLKLVSNEKKKFSSAVIRLVSNVLKVTIV
jgi:hypothetical protein